MCSRHLLPLAALCFLVAGCPRPPSDKPAVDLTAPAAQAIEKAYPGSMVCRAELGTKHKRQVYEADVYREGDAGIQVVVTPDGTIIETEMAVPVSQLPKAVADAVAKAAPGAKVSEAKRVEVLRDEKMKALPTPKMLYEVEVEQGKKEGEMTLAPDGTIVEPLKWQAKGKGDGD